jgi:hypothetical protein
MSEQAALSPTEVSAEVFVAFFSGFSPARGAHEEALLDQEWLIDFF